MVAGKFLNVAVRFHESSGRLHCGFRKVLEGCSEVP